ncbi:MAG: hypothetical protein ACKVJK_18945 [Methylophagaceae bacterium]|jgi:uncharacterized protein YdcH (DUF465 family)|tara:strand:- start:2329 stop:2541 length:213 start_codon:yes stop_codon:yes gene_type:complete
MSKMTSEKTQRHIKSLYEKKKLLDIRIETSYAERVKDEEIQELKHQKVRLNDDIVKYTRVLNTTQEQENG